MADHDLSHEDLEAVDAELALAALAMCDRIMDAIMEAGGVCDNSLIWTDMARTKSDFGNNCVCMPGDVIIRVTRKQHHTDRSFKWVLRNSGSEGIMHQPYRRLAREVGAAALALRESECPQN